jgi:hypothetical protein
MKKNRILLSVSTAYFFVLFLFVYSNVNAQAAYSGGAGGGYASVSVSMNTAVFPADPFSNSTFEVTIYPNPLGKDQIFKAKISGFNANSKLKITISDMIGYQIHFEEVDVSSEVTINLPYERLTKGIYLVTFQHNNTKVTRRFSYTN